MSVKYRITLESENRIIGPFEKEEMLELFSKKLVSSSDKYQIFPIGEWKKMQDFPELIALWNSLTKKTKASTSSSTSASAEHHSIHYRPYQIEKKEDIEIDYEALEKKYAPSAPVEETKVLKISKPQGDKTKIIAPVIEEPTTKVEKSTKMSFYKSEVPSTNDLKDAPMPPVIPDREMAVKSTEVLNLNYLLPSINAQLSVSEVELEKDAKIADQNELIKIKNEILEIENSLESPVIENKKGKKKGMSFVAVLAFIGVFYLLLEPDAPNKKKELNFIYITFPMTNEYENLKESNQELELARSLYSKKDYINRSIATHHYLKSLQTKFLNNEALGELVLTYSELLENTKDRENAEGVIFKLIQVGENKLLVDANLVAGAALFFYKIKKPYAGIQIVKNYLRAHGLKNHKLLSYYLAILIEAGELEEAKKVFDLLKNELNKPFESYYYLAKFCEMNELPKEALDFINRGLSQNEHNPQLLQEKAELLLKMQDMKEYKSTVELLYKSNAESAPFYISKLFYDLGIIKAFEKKQSEASLLFKKSLEIYDNDELRLMLSKLDIAGDKLSQKLILESKVIDFLKKANEAIKNKNLEMALSYGVEAIDAAPDYLPAILMFADLQIARGLYDLAISSLNVALKKNPTISSIREKLVNVYISSFRFDDAQRELTELGQTKYSMSAKFASLTGDFNYAKNNLHMAAKWYGEAISRAPLSDDDLFKLAKIYLRTKNFNESKRLLMKALQLDPRNSKYIASYAEIMFEKDGTDTAVGFLRDKMGEVGENAILLSAITRLYFKSGQLKEFQKYYKKVQDMNNKDESLYEYLIYVATLEEDSKSIIAYSLDLLKLTPGNLKVRLDLGMLYTKIGQYNDAIQEFLEIQNKLPSYPKVNFMLAKVYIATNDLKNAKKFAELELASNPNSDTSYFIMGEVFQLEKNYREAMQSYEKAISLNGHSIEALMGMGEIKLLSNLGNDALELYIRAIKEDKSNPIAHRQMGMAYKMVGQRALAKEKFEDYLKLNPVASDRLQIEAQIKDLKN